MSAIIQQIEAQAQKLAADLNTAHDIINALKSGYMTSKAQVAALTTTNNTLQGQVTSLQTQVTNLTGEVSTLQNQVANPTLSSDDQASLDAAENALEHATSVLAQAATVADIAADKTSVVADEAADETSVVADPSVGTNP